MPKSKQNGASKIRVTTAINNKMATVKRTITVMVGNLVKGTVTIVVLTTKERNHKVKEIVAMIIASKLIIVLTKLVHVLTSKLAQQL